MKDFQKDMAEQVVAAINAATSEDEALDAIEEALYGLRFRLNVEQGRADSEAGRTVHHARVAAWIKTLGTDSELPMPTSADQ